eukprot:12215721-Alexandrium_andersonii.AAC.1
MPGLRPKSRAGRPRPRGPASPSSRASSQPESWRRPALGPRSWPTAMNSLPGLAFAASSLLPLLRPRPRRVAVRPVRP